MPNQNVAGGSSMTTAGAGTGGKISSPNIIADTGIRMMATLNQTSGILTSGGSDAPTDVARAFDTVSEQVQQLIDPSAGNLLPGAPIAGASGVLALLTGRNLMIAGGVLVLAIILWKVLAKKA